MFDNIQGQETYNQLLLDLQFEMIKPSKISGSNPSKSKDKNVALLNGTIRSTSKQTSNLIRNSSNSSLTARQNVAKSATRLRVLPQKQQKQKSTSKNKQSVGRVLSKTRENEKQNIKPSNLNMPAKTSIVDPKRKGNTVSNIRNNLVKGLNNSNAIKKQTNTNNSMTNRQMIVKNKPLEQIHKQKKPTIQIKQQAQNSQNILNPLSIESKVEEQNSILKYIPLEVWTQHKKISTNDFHFISTVQTHTYFKDVLAMHITLNALFNVRIIDKASVEKQQLKRQLIQSITIELYVNKLHLPHLLTLYTVFQDANSVYLVMQPLMLSNKDQENLANCVSVQDKINENLISLYCKQIAQTVNQLHKLKIILRDMNLEFLKVQMGILKITLMDCAASIAKRMRRQSFLADVQKIPQQLAFGRSYNHLYDSWSLGILLYILGTGVKPFSGSKSFRKIQQNNYLLPINTSKELTELIFRLIIEQSQRLPIEKALQHQFFTLGSRQKNMVNKDFWAFWEYSN